jgi:2-polyprenyl-3-methyl-5-hydroxy-6-metoxy-1,4-benzoquinol methylase
MKTEFRMDWLNALIKAGKKEIKEDPEWEIVSRMWQIDRIIAHVRMRDRKDGYTYPRALKSILKYLEPQLTLLDVGCKWGRFSFPFAERGLNVTGIDPDEIPISIANQAVEILGWKNLKFRVGTLKSIVCKFDIIFYGFVLHDIVEESLEQIKEAMNHLTTGGKILILDFEKGFEKIRQTRTLHFLEYLGKASHAVGKLWKIHLVEITK